MLPSVTSLPTWLTTLLTALASGGLAWLAARRTAERNATLARQDEQRRWNRERREKAYVAILDRRDQLVEVKRAWDEGDPDGLGRSITDMKEFANELRAAEESLREALAVIELIGSSEAVRFTRRWVRELCRRPLRPIRDTGRVRPPGKGLPRQRPSPAQVWQAEDPWGYDEAQFRRPFVDLIRKELGVDD